jgi:hypothetical protein
MTDLEAGGDTGSLIDAGSPRRYRGRGRPIPAPAVLGREGKEVHVKRILGQWGLLMVALAAGGVLALHERQPAAALPPPPAHSYTVAQVEAGLHNHPAAWLGHTFWVRSTWWDTCGWLMDPSNLGPNLIPNRTCSLPSPGLPQNGLVDKVSASKPVAPEDPILAVRVVDEESWIPGGPLKLAAGVPAYYELSLSMDSPCTENDGGPVETVTGEAPCPVGTVIEARK